MLAWRCCVDPVCCWGGQVHSTAYFDAHTDTNIATDNAAHSCADCIAHYNRLCWIVVGM